MKPPPLKRKCKAKTSAGAPCQKWAIAGGMVCGTHGGSAPQVAAAAAVRADLRAWGMDDELLDPTETLLRLMSQSKRRADAMAEEIAAKIALAGNFEDALVGDTKILNPTNGSLTKVGEYITAMAVFEAQERERSAKWAKMAIDAGLGAKVVEMQQQQAALIHEVLAKVFDLLGLSDEQQQRIPAVMTQVLALGP